MWATKSRRYTVCVNMAMALHHTHTLWNAVSAGYGWILYYSLELFHNVLPGGELPHKSYLLPTECTCIHESDCGVYNTSECTLVHVH